MCLLERSALEPLPVNAGEFCNVCQIVVTYIDNELEENETQAEIGTLLVKGCHLLPKPLTDKVTASSYCGDGRSDVPYPSG